MNDKEIGEIRRHLRRERSNITQLFGCFVNDNKEIITEFRQSTGIMPENESDKYFALLRRTLSGSIGRNLIDITFKTSQVADSPEHKLLMGLRESKCNDEELRAELYKKIIDSVVMEGNYLILLCCDSYDVPFKSKDDDTQTEASGEVYTYIQCAICPVKQTKPTLQYVAEEKELHEGENIVTPDASELFLFHFFLTQAKIPHRRILAFDPGEGSCLLEKELPEKDALILVYCRSGRRSKIASEELVKLGYTNVKEFGGIIDWEYEIVK